LECVSTCAKVIHATTHSFGLICTRTLAPFAEYVALGKGREGGREGWKK
jgi:hypothetical protein